DRLSEGAEMRHERARGLSGASRHCQEISISKSTPSNPPALGVVQADERVTTRYFAARPSRRYLSTSLVICCCRARERTHGAGFVEMRIRVIERCLFSAQRLSISIIK